MELAKTKRENGIRARKSLSSAKVKGAAWGLRQARMVEEIASHALQGGRAIVGATASDEEAIDAYLQRLKRDLVKGVALES